MSRYHSYGPPRRDYQDTRPKRETEDELLQISGIGKDVVGIGREIARSCFRCAGLLDENQQVQLILGIKSNGASEALIPARLSNLRSNGGSYDRRTMFSSFSPITFARVELLESFLKDHAPQNAKKGSSANKAYELGSTNQEEHIRCLYERIRTIFRVLTNRLPYSPSLYGISPTCPPDIISEFLLISHNTYNLMTITGFIDAAWGIVETTSLKQSDIELEKIQPQVKQDLHFQNDLLTGGMAKKRCAYVETTAVDDPSDPAITLKQYLQQYHARSSTSAPVCVITYDWEKTRNLLGQMDINSSVWSSDLRGLMESDQPTHLQDQKGSHAIKRSRSRSPLRGRREEGYVNSTASASGLTNSPTIYVIDMKTLYTTVRRNAAPKERLVEACQDFDLPEVDEEDLKVVCAGNELKFLWNLFVKMADGPSVDHMYDAQFKGRTVATTDDEDEEGDDTAGIVVPARSTNPYDFDDDPGLLSD